MQDTVLRECLVQLLRGGSAYVKPETALAGVRSELRTARPGPDLHSIWEHLEHMRIAQMDILRYMVDPEWKSPEWPDGYWRTSDSSMTDESWSNTVDSFFADLEEAVRLVQETGLDLTSRIPEGGSHTYLREILLIADHNAYHIGQIVQIRKLFGDWAP